MKCLEYHRQCEAKYWLFYLATVENKSAYLTPLIELLKFGKNSITNELFEFYKLNAPIFLPILCKAMNNQAEAWSRFVNESISSSTKIESLCLLKLIDFKYRLFKEKNETRHWLSKMCKDSDAEFNKKVLSVFKRTVDKGERMWENYLALSFKFFKLKQIENAAVSLIETFRNYYSNSVIPRHDDLLSAQHFKYALNQQCAEYFILYFATYVELRDKSELVSYALDFLLFLEKNNECDVFGLALAYLNRRFHLIEHSNFLPTVLSSHMNNLRSIINMFKLCIASLEIKTVFNLVKFMFANCDMHALINASVQLISAKLTSNNRGQQKDRAAETLKSKLG